MPTYSSQPRTDSKTAIGANKAPTRQSAPNTSRIFALSSSKRLNAKNTRYTSSVNRKPRRIVFVNDSYRMKRTSCKRPYRIRIASRIEKRIGAEPLSVMRFQTTGSRIVKASIRRLFRSKSWPMPIVGILTSIGGCTNISRTYSARGVESFFAATAITGTATSTYNQKLGLTNDVTVRMYQTVRRRAKSSGAVNCRHSGLAAQNIIVASARTTTSALRLTRSKVGWRYRPRRRWMANTYRSSAGGTHWRRCWSKRRRRASRRTLASSPGRA